ncbi:Cyclic-di-AMP phosphodiesterase PgpH [Nymphon striatum]|nr:Cyclic-di-AMP phosphodiesterase PgpH [Nymphon striatum]
MSKSLDPLYKNQSLIYKYILYGVSLFCIVFFFPKGGQFKYEFQKGKAWQHENLKAPFDFSIKKKTAEIEAEEQAIVDNQITFYRYNISTRDKVLKNFSTKFSSVFSDDVYNEEQLESLSLAGKSIIDRLYKKGVTNKTNLTNPPDQIYLLRNNEADQVGYKDLNSLKDIDKVIDQTLRENQLQTFKGAYHELFLNLILPNVTYDENLSKKALNDELSKVSHTRGTIDEGSLIIAKGELVDADNFKVITSLKGEYQSELYTTFHIIHEGNLENIVWVTLGLFLLNGMITLFVQPLIYIYEKIFGLVSDVSLLELSDTNSKLLKELSNKAPGTFHHSLQVSNLAEAAANEVGANAMLVRVGALYHDIGKMLNPTYFTENQITNVNPHDELSPKDSAKIIIDHVIGGIELARKNNLPDRVIDFIRCHHGTTLVYYFFKKQEEIDPNVNEDDFRYPGPIPFSKETAILMMADSRSPVIAPRLGRGGRRFESCHPDEPPLGGYQNPANQRSEFSIKRDIAVCNWDIFRCRAKETDQNLILLNAYLDDVYAEVLNAHKQLHSERKLITAKGIKLRYFGEDEERMSLMKAVAYHNANFNNALKPGSLKNYFSTEKYLQQFLKERLKTDDIYLIQLNYRFIVNFENYIRTYKPKKARRTCTNNGVMKHLQRLIKIINLCLKMEWLEKDPFRSYKVRYVKNERDYLSERELELIETTSFTELGLSRVKDIFLFSCYTGLSYIDIKELHPNQILLGIDGNKWIHTKRAKTNEPVKIPLLVRANKILDKYEDEMKITGEILPVYSNQKTNKYLKEIAEACGIHKNVTFHVARHTFATTITLSNGVPIETVSKLLGHTKLSTTQIYARVLQKKVGEDMQDLMNLFEAKKKQRSEAPKSYHN